MDHLAKVGDRIEILGRKVERTTLEYRLIMSSRYIDQSLKDMDMEKCNPVSTPGHEVTERELATEEQRLYQRVTGRLLHVARQRPDAQRAVEEIAQGMGSPTIIHWHV